MSASFSTHYFLLPSSFPSFGHRLRWSAGGAPHHPSPCPHDHPHPMMIVQPPAHAPPAPLRRHRCRAVNGRPRHLRGSSGVPSRWFVASRRRKESSPAHASRPRPRRRRRRRARAAASSLPRCRAGWGRAATRARARRRRHPAPRAARRRSGRAAATRPGRAAAPARRIGEAGSAASSEVLEVRGERDERGTWRPLPLP